MKSIIKAIKQRYTVNTTCYGGIVSDVCFVSKSDKLKSISVIVKRSDPNELVYLASRDFKDIEYKSIFGDIATKMVPHMFTKL